MHVCRKQPGKLQHDCVNTAREQQVGEDHGVRHELGSNGDEKKVGLGIALVLCGRVDDGGEESREEPWCRGKCVDNVGGDNLMLVLVWTEILMWVNTTEQQEQEQQQQQQQQQQ